MYFDGSCWEVALLLIKVVRFIPEMFNLMIDHFFQPFLSRV